VKMCYTVTVLCSTACSLWRRWSLSCCSSLSRRPFVIRYNYLFIYAASVFHVT